LKKKRGREDGKTSRHLAVTCLVQWERDRSAIQPLVSSTIYSSPLAAGDKQLAVTLVQGVLRQMEYLDAIISRFSQHPLAKMKPLTRMALRIGVYQLLFLDRVPASAAVNETVKVMKAERQPGWIISFVNGLLRTISRSRSGLPGPEMGGENGSVMLNHPQWLVRRWQKRFGQKKTEEICSLNNSEPQLVLRVNTLRTDAGSLAERFAEKGIQATRGRYAPDSLVVVSSAGAVTEMPGYEKGLFHVQDEAAQLATFLLGPFVEDRDYLDACAGLGGKTCQLAQLVTERSTLVAVEPSHHRYRLLQENLRRLGFGGRVQCVSGEIGGFVASALRLYHAVLVDAPCSGTGVIRRHPDIRWNRGIEDLQTLQRQQLQILQHAASLLRPGGVLVYATCSMEPEENEQVIDSFLARNTGFSLDNAAGYLPAAAWRLISPEGYFSTTPAEGLDGFFGARMVRGAE